MKKLTTKEENNFRDAINDLEISIPKDEKALEEAIESKEFISNFKFNDKDIKFKNNIIEILEFYINDLKENTDFCKRQKENYDDILKRGYA